MRGRRVWRSDAAGGWIGRGPQGPFEPRVSGLRPQLGPILTAIWVLRAGIQQGLCWNPGAAVAVGTLLTCSLKYYPAHSWVGLDKAQVIAFF